MTKVFFAAPETDWQDYEELLPKMLSDVGLDAEFVTGEEPDAVDYIVYAPTGGLKDFSPFVNCKAVLSLWAGVERIAGNSTITMPLARMVDDGLTEGMVEWCVGHTLRYHLGMDLDTNRSEPKWEPHVPPLARERTVGILGLGALGEAVAKALVGLNFNVVGWSRSPKDIDGVTCFHGETDLRFALAKSEILITLLPLTKETENILDAEAFAVLPKGGYVINPGRGPLIDDAALIDALDTGHIAHATLDVFRVEPLPSDHAFWAHPKVTVTPHIAADTRASGAARAVVENIRRSEAGEALLNLVDRGAGY